MKTVRFTLLFIGFFSFINSSIAQLTLSIDTVISDIQSKYFYFDSVTFVLKYQNGKYNLLKDTVVTQSDIPNFAIRSYFYEKKAKKLYMEAFSSEPMLVSLNFNTGKFSVEHPISRREDVTLSRGLAYYITDTVGVFRIEHVDTGLKKSYDINDLLKTKDLDILKIIIGDDSNFLVNVGYIEDGESYGTAYYIFHEPNMSFQKLIPEGNLKEVLHNHGLYLLGYTIDKDYAFFSNGIIDSSFNFYSGSIFRYGGMGANGFIFVKNELKQLLVSTSLDDKYFDQKNSNQIRVLIPSLGVVYNCFAVRQRLLVLFAVWN